MSKKNKTSKTKRLTTKTTTAPMIVRATAPETSVAAPPIVAQAPVAAAVTTDATLDREMIARLAFSKFLARGCTHGHALEDWLAAEAELRASFDARTAKA